jgi:hypothetical protein
LITRTLADALRPHATKPNERLKKARTWREINPDIFGSMIQAVVDADMRGDLGMHYTSVPNIVKVLQPLFLMSLEEQPEPFRASLSGQRGK